MIRVCLQSLLFFFFKQKTAYEMRISDWSSDVCSSDLSPRAPQSVFDSGLPILGICYGQQVMSQQLGGQVEPGGADGERDGEFGRAFLTVTEPCVLFDGLWEVGERHQVWMSHGDRVTQLDRKSVVEGKVVSVRVHLGGGRRIRTKKRQNRE